MKINKIVELVQNTLGSDVRGQCYTASEAIYLIAGGKKSGLKPVQLIHEGVSHWWLEYNGKVIDVTAKQFNTPVPYEKGRGRGFYPNPKSRTLELLQKIDY